MRTLQQEIADFKAGKQAELSAARQTAALQIIGHLDLTEAMRADPETRKRLVVRLERMIERERQKGVRRHWSYDLNRHIALKQALDRLLGPGRQTVPKPRIRVMRKSRPSRQNGAS